MKHVFALFSDATAAEEAVKKLSESGLDTTKARIHSKQTIQDETSVRAMPGANPVSSTGAVHAGAAGGTAAGPGVGAVMTDDTIEGYLQGIGVDGDEFAFYMHGIKGGGYIVGIDVSNDEAEKAAAVLSETGGKAPQAE